MEDGFTIDQESSDPDRVAGLRDFRGEAFAMRPIVSSEGRVIDGYNRIAQAIADGATEIDILQGQPQVKGKERKKFRSHEKDPYRAFGDEATELPEKFKFVQTGSTLQIGNQRWTVTSINDFHHYITVEKDFGKYPGLSKEEGGLGEDYETWHAMEGEDRTIGYTQLELLNAQHVQQEGQDFRIIRNELIQREVRGSRTISVGDGKAPIQAPYATEKDLIEVLGNRARYYEIVEVDAPINQHTGKAVTEQLKSKTEVLLL